MIGGSTGGEFAGAVEGFDVGEQRVHGLAVQARLLVDHEGLFVQVVGIAKSSRDTYVEDRHACRHTITTIYVIVGHLLP